MGCVGIFPYRMLTIFGKFGEQPLNLIPPKVPLARMVTSRIIRDGIVVAHKAFILLLYLLSDCKGTR